MKISIVGMSNIGKTRWSNNIKKIGFRRIGCDDLIIKLLASEIKFPHRLGRNFMAEWLGQPYDKRYAKNSRIYLNAERQVIEKYIYDIKNNLINEKDVVLDTTGSIVYLNKGILQSLRRCTTIVLLDTPDSIKKQMYCNYLKNPKPVIWGSSFKKRKGQTNKEAIRESYPKLLKYRNKIYTKYADVILDYSLIRRKDFDSRMFIKTCRKIH